MNTLQAVWMSSAVAAVLANLPFFRLLTVRRWHPAVTDFVGWLAGYAVWMCVAAVLEAMSGRPAAKGWEVWAVTIALFAVLAFPGIVWRHLLQNK